MKNEKKHDLLKNPRTKWNLQCKCLIGETQRVLADDRQVMNECELVEWTSIYMRHNQVLPIDVSARSFWLLSCVSPNQFNRKKHTWTISSRSDCHTYRTPKASYRIRKSTHTSFFGQFSEYRSALLLLLLFLLTASAFALSLYDRFVYLFECDRRLVPFWYVLSVLNCDKYVRGTQIQSEQTWRISAQNRKTISFASTHNGAQTHTHTHIHQNVNNSHTNRSRKTEQIKLIERKRSAYNADSI